MWNQHCQVHKSHITSVGAIGRSLAQLANLEAKLACMTMLSCYTMKRYIIQHTRAHKTLKHDVSI